MAVTRCAVCGMYWNDLNGVTAGQFLNLCANRDLCEKRAGAQEHDRNVIYASAR